MRRALGAIPFTLGLVAIAGGVFAMVEYLADVRLGYAVQVFLAVALVALGLALCAFGLALLRRWL